MARLGRLAVDIGLGVDQTTADLDCLVVDGQQLTRITPHYELLDDDAVVVDHSYVMEASFRYGRDRFIHGDFETGTGQIVLNNDTGEWTPNSGVNEIGGDKLRPGMIVHILYMISRDMIGSWLNDNTVGTWTSTTPNAAYRSIADSETYIGFVDGCTWTTHGTDMDITVSPNQNPGLTEPYNYGYPRFAGRIYSIEDRYEEGGRGAITVVTLTDYQADLALIAGPLSSPRAAEDADDRIESGVYQSVNTLGMRITAFHTPNIYQVEASDLPGNRLEEARVVARAVGGEFFCYHSHYGRWAFCNSNWINTGRGAVITAKVGNDRIGITAASTDYSIARVFNNLIYSNSSTDVTASDATSIAAYSTRTLSRTLLNNDNTDLQTIADRDLAILKDAKLVIRSVTIKPETLFEIMFAMQVEVGDKVEVTVVNNGWEYTQELHVSGIAGRWAADTDDWELTLRLDSRDGDTVLS
jgi:hypothetical protein